MKFKVYIGFNVTYVFKWLISQNEICLIKVRYCHICESRGEAFDSDWLDEDDAFNSSVSQPSSALSNLDGREVQSALTNYFNALLHK